MSARAGTPAVAVGDESGISLRAAVVAAGERWATGQRRLVQLVAALNASGEWALDGSSSCARWVADAVDVEVCTAREWIRVGSALLDLDVLSHAFAQGLLSYSKVRTLTRIATPENQAELYELARQVSAGRLGHALASWLAGHESAIETETRQSRARSFGWRTDFDGMIVGGFRLPPAMAAKITCAVDALLMQATPTNPRANASADAFHEPAHSAWPTIAQQRADALIELIEGDGATVTTEIVMHVRADGCTLDNGTPIPGSVVERIAPKAFLRALIHDAQSRPINASGRQRHPTERQRRVVKARDQACVDCGAIEFLQYDHDPDFDQTHRTVVDELRLRCWTCHRDRHRQQNEQRLDAA